MKVSWTPEALQDRRDIYDHIDPANPVAAAKLDETIVAAATKLNRHPTMGRPGRLPETREWVVRPNYILIYSNLNSEIQILRVIHAARRWPNPENP